MPQFIRVAFLLAMSSPLNGAYKGGTPPKLADEQAERLKGCQERVLLAYERACAERKQFERDNQSIVAENLAALFGEDSSNAAEYRYISATINALIAQKLLQRYQQSLETCRAKNAQQALNNI